MRTFQYMQQCSEAIESQRCLCPPPHTCSPDHWHAKGNAAKDHHALMCHALQQQRIRLGKETAEHHYINESNMVNRLVLGMESKQWLAQQGLEGELRRHLTANQLEQIAYLERRNAILLDTDMPFTERKKLLTTLLVYCTELARDVHWGSPDADA